MGIIYAGVFINIFPQRRSRLGLLCSNVSAGVRLHFILEIVVENKTVNKFTGCRAFAVIDTNVGIQKYFFP